MHLQIIMVVGRVLLIASVVAITLGKASYFHEKNLFGAVQILAYSVFDSAFPRMHH